MSSPSSAFGSSLTVITDSSTCHSGGSSEQMPIAAFFENIRSITVKMTGGCNLRCKYCNVDTVSPNTPKMSLDLWKRIVDLLIINSKHDQVSVEFHGGEPLLLGVDFLVEAANYAYTLGSLYGKTVDVPLVTNGTMLTPDVVDRLRESRVGIAISCDGPPEINDLVRGGGKSVERAIRLLQEKNYSGGVMTVVSEANWNRMYDVMSWFRTLEVRGYAINFIQPQGRGITFGLLSGNQMFEAIAQIFRHMDETSVSVIEQKLAQQIERFVVGRPPRSVGCWDFECQAGKTYVSIDLHGQIHACGSDVTNHILGSVDDGMIDVARCRSKLVALHKKADRTLECFDCSARKICDHSCPTADYNTLAYAEAECLATKKTWKHFCENTDAVRRVYSSIQKFAFN